MWLCNSGDNTTVSVKEDCRRVVVCVKHPRGMANVCVLTPADAREMAAKLIELADEAEKEGE